MIRIPPQRGGWLEVICGPMFSGKSEEMIRRLRRAEIAGQRVVIFKPRIDDRFDAADVVSHAGARMRGVPVSSVAELEARARGFEVVGIDEVQFFEPSVVGVALGLAEAGVRVVAAGLDQDFRRLPFGPMPSFSPTPSSSTSCRRSVIAAAGPRRRRSGWSTAVRRRTQERQWWSALRSSTKHAAAIATSRARTRSARQRPRSAPATSAIPNAAAATRTIVPPGGRSA